MEQTSSVQDANASGGTVPGWVGQQSIDYTAAAAGEGVQTWDGNAPVYEWNDDFGDIGPKFPQVELDLFGDPATRNERTGVDFSKSANQFHGAGILLICYRIDQIDVQQEGPVKINPIRSFKDAGLHPVLLENIELSGYDNPTPIQKYTIPSMLQGYDVIGVAQTGTFQDR